VSEQTGSASSTKKPRAPRKPKKPAANGNGNGHAGFEEVQLQPDPVEELVAKVHADIENAYVPETVTMLAGIYAVNIGLYLKICARLKDANELFSKVALDKLVPLHSDFDSLSPGGPCGSDGPPCFAIRR
jgi:hypothetical protein